MRADEAAAILGLIKGAWPSLYLDEYGVKAWEGFIVKQDFDVAMSAFRQLSERQRERPTIADLRHMIIKVEVDMRMSNPALEEVTLKRPLPEDVKEWMRDRFPSILKAMP